MKFTELIKAIQDSGIENAETLAKSLTDHVNSLNTEADKKIQKLNSQIENLTAAIGIETGTTEERLAAAKNSLATLTKERDDLKAEKEKLQTQITQSQKQELIRSAAEKGKASAEVLSALISDEELKVEGDTVTVNGKPLKDWASENKSAFLTALFPETTNTTKQLPNTPPHSKKEDGKGKGKDNSGDQNDKSVTDRYFEQTYKVPDFVTQ